MGLFDFNGNGEMDAFDSVTEFLIVEDEFGDEQEKRENILEENGIDPFDFEFMDDDEKVEALEDVGLDPFDFDL